MKSLVFKLLICMTVAIPAMGQSNRFEKQRFFNSYSIDIHELAYRGSGTNDLSMIVYLRGRTNGHLTELGVFRLGNVVSNRKVNGQRMNTLVISKRQMEAGVQHGGIMAIDNAGHNLVFRIVQYRTMVDKKLMGGVIPLKTFKSRPDKDLAFTIGDPDKGDFATLVIRASESYLRGESLI